MNDTRTQFAQYFEGTGYALTGTAEESEQDPAQEPENYPAPLGTPEGPTASNNWQLFAGILIDNRIGVNW